MPATIDTIEPVATIAYSRPAGPHYATQAYYSPAAVGPFVKPVELAESLKSALEGSGLIARTLLSMVYNDTSSIVKTETILKMHKIGHHWARRGKLLTYCPANREQVINADGTWARKGRQEIKPGKLANAVFNGQVSGADIEVFADAFKDHKIEFLTGDAIADVYTEYEGPGSCMDREHNSQIEWFDIYTQNPETVSMAIIRKSSNAIIARAICYTTTNGDKIWARCYGIGALKPTLESLGYRKWDRQDRVKLENWEFDSYPYLDSLSYLDSDGHINYSSGTILDSTNGGSGGYTCEHCNDDVREDELHVIHDQCLCDSCADDYVYFGYDGYASSDDCHDASSFTSVDGDTMWVESSECFEPEEIDVEGGDTIYKHNDEYYTRDAFMEAGYTQTEDGDWCDDDDMMDMQISECGGYLADSDNIRD